MAEGEYQRRRDQDDRGHFEQVAPGARVLERMGRVDAEEAAAIGAQLLDGDLAGRRAERDGLLGALQGGGMDIVEEGLRHALPDQQQRQQQAQRQQHVEGAAGQVDPEVAQLSCGAAADAARQGHQHAEADRRADEVLHREADHLAEVAQRGLAAVGLPVGIGDETDRGVERQCPFQARQVLRVQRQAALQHEDREQQDQAGQVECQQRQGVGLPVLLARRIDAEQAIADALQWRQRRAEEIALAFHHLEAVAPEERCRHQDQGEKGQDQENLVAVHVPSPRHGRRVAAPPANRRTVPWPGPGTTNPERSCVRSLLRAASAA